MTRYRKKPVMIKAFQMTMFSQSGQSPFQGSLFIDPASKERLCIGTLEGVHHVLWDDWIIRGMKGELYPCKPDIFDATYEPVL